MAAVGSEGRYGSAGQHQPARCLCQENPLDRLFNTQREKSLSHMNALNAVVPKMDAGPCRLDPPPTRRGELRATVS
ncbi:hypothetical protein QTO34_020085 [Cnephaeus nilssonii]|uniref:Uncharacterized protein n=1 Tax=Cnephaeus nilssonii TaxID=3371016 RepID=A0AA40HYX2_CNENI|nr:hypothetical protein QTO34_020085 [Eptesicus nilssonii]